jgi:hypothetical protein
MNRRHNLQGSDPAASLDLESLSADPAVVALFADIVAERPVEALASEPHGRITDDRLPIRLGRRPEQLRRRRRLLLVSFVLLVLLGASLSVVLGRSGVAGPHSTPYRAARAVPLGTHLSSPHGAAGVWQLTSEVVSTGWQQNTSGPPPGELSCPSAFACYAISGDYPSALASAPLLSESLYVSANLGLTWSVLPMPDGFASTTPLSCPERESCAVGGTIKGQSVFATTSDGGHQWTLTPLRVPTGELLYLTCISTSECNGVVGSSSFNPNTGPAIPTHDTELPSESFVLTTDGGLHWLSKPLIANEGIDAMDCPDAAHCVLLGSIYPQHRSLKSFVLVTTDRGMTWKSGRLPTGAATTSGLSCTSASECMALIAVRVPSSSGNYVSEAAITTDGGVAWKSRPFPSDVPSPGVSNIACPGAGECWVAGFEAVPEGANADSPILLGTSNGGITWTKVTFAVPAGAPNYDGQSFQAIGPIACPDTHGCIALGAVAQGSPSTPVYRLVSTPSH